MPAHASPKLAIYPGSFDPVTDGHLDLIKRAALLFDRIIVAVLQNSAKQPLFTVPERIEMLRECVTAFPNVAVDSFNGLLADYAASLHATAVIRGIRAISDYEIELQMALINRRLRPGTETVFLPAGEEFSFISSRMIKEIISLGGDVSQFVPPPVTARLGGKFPRSLP